MRTALLIALCAVNALAGSTGVVWRGASGITDFRETLDPSLYGSAVLWMPMNANPAGYATWSVEDGSAARNNGTQATTNSRPAFQSGSTNGSGCLLFDGAGDMVDLPVFTTSAGAFMAWIRTTNENTTVWSVTKKDSTGENYFQFVIGDGVSSFLTSELLTLIIRNTGIDTVRAGYCTTTRTVLLDNRWHHVAWSTGASSYLAWIDGAQVPITYAASTVSNSWTGVISPDTSTIGAGWFNSGVIRSLKGSIDGVAIFTRELTSNEVFTAYTQQKGSHP